MTDELTKAQKLKQLIESDEILVLPGCHDVLTAKIAEEEDFKAVFFNDCGLAAFSFGIPDIGLLTLTEMAEMLRRVTRAVKIPVMADGANGFGGPLNVYRTVEEYIHAGAVSINLDDQDFPKRCGHMAGKRIIPVGTMIAKLEAAVDASRGHDFLIVARTDAMGVAGVNEAIRRGNLYAKRGASLIFVDAPTTTDEIKALVKGIKAPVLINQVEGGRTPLLRADELQKLGAAVAQYCTPSFFVLAKALKDFYKVLKQKGTSREDLSMMETFPPFNSRLEMSKFIELDDKYLSIEKQFEGKDEKE
jgi:2-methylisocitrate lyase-like PEP mutase family enzyme